MLGCPGLWVPDLSKGLIEAGWHTALLRTCSGAESGDATYTDMEARSPQVPTGTSHGHYK